VNPTAQNTGTFNPVVPHETITPLKSHVNTTAQNTGAFNPVEPHDTQTPLKINVNTPPQNTGAFVPVLPPIQLLWLLRKQTTTRGSVMDVTRKCQMQKNVVSAVVGKAEFGDPQKSTQTLK